VLLGLVSSSISFHIARLEKMNYVIYPQVNVNCQLTLTCTVHMNGEMNGKLTDRHVPTHVEQFVNN
jgi:hypothetical protein